MHNPQPCRKPAPDALCRSSLSGCCAFYYLTIQRCVVSSTALQKCKSGLEHVLPFILGNVTNLSIQDLMLE